MWKVGLTDSGPAKVRHCETHLKSDLVPRRARARKYAPKHRDWMIKHVKMLEQKGVPKQKSKQATFFSGSDCSQAWKTNELSGLQLCKLPGPASGEIYFQHMEKAAWFSSLDAFRGSESLPWLRKVKRYTVSWRNWVCLHQQGCIRKVLTALMPFKQIRWRSLSTCCTSGLMMTWYNLRALKIFWLVWKKYVRDSENSMTSSIHSRQSCVPKQLLVWKENFCRRNQVWSRHDRESSESSWTRERSSIPNMHQR